MSDQSKTEITVRVCTLIKIAVVGLAIALLFYLSDIIALLVVSLILAVLMGPVADFCERHRLPRALGVAVVYVIFFGFFGFLFTLIAQPIVAEVRNLAGAIPAAWERIAPLADALRAFSIEHGIVDQLQQFASGLEGKVTAGVFGALSGTFGGVLSFILVLVFTFYLTTSATAVRRTLIGFAPSRFQPFLIGVVPRIERKMGSWLRGLLTLALIMGTFVFIGLSILRVEYALLIALLTAAMEVVPYIGAPIAAVVAVILTLLQSPVKAFFVLVFYIVAQQIENHLLVPKVMQRAVGIHPVTSMIALLVGAKVGGIPGALLAIPIAAGIIVFIEEYARDRRSRETASAAV